MPTQPGLDRIPCAPHELVARAAAAIVERHRAQLPDLGGVVVLIPDLHAAPDIAAALRVAAGVPALLLPRIATLGLWAATVPLDRPIASRASRETLLYQELEKRGWLPTADLWAVSAELVGLFDELTRHNVALPADFKEFNRQLARAYRAQSGASLTFEARLVHELWHALARVTGAADPEAAYQLRLARLAENASAPLYALSLAPLAPAEQHFLERYAERAPVQCFASDITAGRDAVSRVLAAAWPANPDDAPLLERARTLKAGHPESPLAGRLRVLGAAGAEQEAQAVDATVREWLLAGRKRIAIVVHDRLVARRARALLERAQVLVKDEAGWAFSTTSAATAIGRWLDVAGGDCYFRDLLDLLKSPFAFHDWPPATRQAAVWRLEGYVREENVVAGLANFIHLAEEHNDPEARQMLARIRAGTGALGRGTRPIARWLASLMVSLDHIGVREGLSADSAGQQLLDLLDRLGQELAADKLGVSFSAWRRWLARQLETAAFRDPTIESGVVFTSLAATPLRRFDAVLLLGCDAAHWPGPDPVSLFFNQGVRAELKLPTWAERVREMEAQLGALVAGCGSVAATWQRMPGGEPNQLSPPLERLAALHRLAYGSGLDDGAAISRLAGSEVRAPGEAAALEPTQRPAPRAPASLLPRKISASGYNSLVACPYQFYARYVLGLAELDEVQEMIEKRDYGTLVHRVLTQFHQTHPAISGLEPADAQRELEALSEKAFAGAVARDYLAQAWFVRWQALIPAYLDWQRGREAAGWTWQGGEVRKEVALTTPQGAALALHGRLDRVDARELSAASRQPPDDSSPTKPSAASHQPSAIPLLPSPPAGGGVARSAGVVGALDPPPHTAGASSRPSTLEFSVIDYKTRDALALRQALESPGEDVQLPVYALLWGAPVAEALFLSMERGEVREVGIEHDVAALVQVERERLGRLFDALAAGAAMPAQGAEAVCEYCEMRGLCRKNYWP